MHNDDRRTSPRTGAGARVPRAAPLPARACFTHEEW
jgi:hypothetical protein